MRVFCLRRLVFAWLLAFLAASLSHAQDEDPGDEPPPGTKDEVPMTVAPAWTVGDWWKIECHPMAGVNPKQPNKPPTLEKDRKTTVTCTFQVVEMKTLDGNRCFVLEMTNDQFDTERVTLIVRSSNLTLKRMEQTDDGETSSVIDNPSKTYVHSDTGLLIPLDLPRLPREGTDETVADTIGTGTREFIQTTKYADGGRTAVVEIKTQINGKPLVSTQVWKAGHPWWVEARRVLDGVEMETGRLVDWSGRKD